MSYRIGIDASALLVPTKTGVEFYVSSLVSALCGMISGYPDMTLFLYTHSGNKYARAHYFVEGLRTTRQVVIREWAPARGFRLAIAAMAFHDGLDVLHMPAPAIVRFRPCSVVLTVHDLCWLRLPDAVIAGERSLASPTSEAAIREASAVIAVSENTRSDVIDLLGVPPSNVWVTYEGARAFQQPTSQQVAAALGKHGLDRYILCVGTIQRRKNLPRLLEAYARLLAHSQIPHKLVIVGDKGWGSEETYNAVENLGLDGYVKFLGYVPDLTLDCLYSAADLFVYPSLYEGFGLPVLEAMNCGTPVAVSNCSSLPEVAGNAAIYFDPKSVDSIEHAMHQVLRDPDLSSYLREKGIERAKEFTWRRTAEQTINVYRSIARRR